MKIEMKSITKKFGKLIANSDVDFVINPGEVHALVGENGAGKTTLMRILFGQYSADSGKIYIDGKEENYDIKKAFKIGIAMVHQNFMQIDNMSVLENIILGHAPLKNALIDYKSARREIQGLLKRFKLDISCDRNIDTLCVGERQKIEIVKALYLGAKILILDEPTAVLTAQESEELFSVINELKKEGKSIVFISHKLREVKRISDKITVMRHGKVSGYMQAENVDEAAIARAMIGKQDVMLLQNNNRGSVGDVLLEVRNLWCFSEQGIPKLSGVNFEVKQGEILGIGGVEGNGQTELINALIGYEKISNGDIKLNGEDVSKLSIIQRREKGIGYISEDRMTQGLALAADMKDNIICGLAHDKQFSANGFLKTAQTEKTCEKLIKDFDIRGIEKKKTVQKLSGGNMQKIVLAREMSRTPKLLIAAQPTRGLDIGAINFVREKLIEEKKRNTAIILVSADLEELLSLSDRLIIFYDGNISGEVLASEIESNGISEEELGLMMGGIIKSKTGDM